MTFFTLYGQPGRDPRQKADICTILKTINVNSTINFLDIVEYARDLSNDAYIYGELRAKRIKLHIVRIRGKFHWDSNEHNLTMYVNSVVVRIANIFRTATAIMVT